MIAVLVILEDEPIDTPPIAALREGGARSRANAILDGLRRRGIAVSDADAQRVLAYRDESALALHWERALSATSAAGPSSK